MAPRPFDIFLDDDLLGLLFPAPPAGDTMEVTSDKGPTLDQLNIPAAGATINDISITATKAGHTLLLTHVRYEGNAAAETVAVQLRKNGVVLAGSVNAAKKIAVAAETTPLINIAAEPAALVGDIFTLFASANAATADILANTAILIMITP